MQTSVLQCGGVPPAMAAKIGKKRAASPPLVPSPLKRNNAQRASSSRGVLRTTAPGARCASFNERVVPRLDLRTRRPVHWKELVGEKLPPRLALEKIRPKTQQVYARALGEFKAWLMVAEVPDLTAEMFDDVLCDFLEFLFESGRPQHVGLRTLAGLLWIRPTLGAPLKKVFPAAMQSLNGWKSCVQDRRDLQSHGPW